MLEMTTLHNSMILSTLSISSRGFAFVSPKGLVPMETVFLTYIPMIFLLIIQCGTTSFNNPQCKLPSNVKFKQSGYVLSLYK